jgi:hypothetical protein
MPESEYIETKSIHTWEHGHSRITKTTVVRDGGDPATTYELEHRQPSGLWVNEFPPHMYGATLENDMRNLLACLQDALGEGKATLREGMCETCADAVGDDTCRSDHPDAPSTNGVRKSCWRPKTDAKAAIHPGDRSCVNCLSGPSECERLHIGGDGTCDAWLPKPEAKPALGCRECGRDRACPNNHAHLVPCGLWIPKPAEERTTGAQS